MLDIQAVCVIKNMNLLRKKILVLMFISILILFLIVLGYSYVKLDRDKDEEETVIARQDERFFSIATNTPHEINQIKPLSINNCDNIIEEEQKQLCIDNYLLNRYVMDHDLKGCTQIYDLEMRDECIFLIAKQHTTEAGSENNCKRIVNLSKREECLTVMSRYRPYNLENNICQELYYDQPFEKKECLDRNLAMQIYDMIVDESDPQKKQELIKLCSPDLALEYGIQCIQGAIKAMDDDCAQIDDSIIKDYCETYKIAKQDKRTVSDCNRMPLNNHRQVCLKEIELQKSKFDFDSDQDGKSDGGELFFNIDPFNPDTDGDGLKDGDEILKFHANPVSKDTDGDGLNDYEEVRIGADTQRIDTDKDGLKDGEDDDPINATNDKDGDKLSDEIEIKWGTDPNNKDTDGDGVTDAAEIMFYGTDPLGEGWSHDTDGDGLMDIDEIFYLTDIFNPDTDGDGLMDGGEIKNLTNPLGEGQMDFDEDGMADSEEEKIGRNSSLNEIKYPDLGNYSEQNESTQPRVVDKDGDGLTDSEEIELGTDPNNSDSDDDGLSDLDEIKIYQTNPLKFDTDNDGYSDNDEILAGYDPNKEE